MDKKFQVFISSTYEDLKDERDQAIKAVLEMGHIPVGMEMFSAGNEEQWQLIARQIESSDYYVIIVAHRYGSETKEGISYTEKEYDYAKDCGVPTLGFVIDEKAPWPSDRVDKNTNVKRKLDGLKSKVKSKLVQFWSGKEDLHGKISISLIKTMNTHPRTGWSRVEDAISLSVTKELSRLSGENAVLRAENKKLTNNQIDAVDEVRTVVDILHANERVLSIRSEENWDTASKHTRTLLKIFLATAPNLISENTTAGIAADISLSIVFTDYYHFWPFGKNITEHLVADLAALDLIETSKKKHPVSDRNTYWALTKLGKQVHKRSRRIQLEQGINVSEGDSVTEANDNE